VKKKTLLTAASISALLLSAIVGIHFLNLVFANGIPVGTERTFGTPPVISINSPMNNETFSTDVLLNFTMLRPDTWLIHAGYNAQQILKSVNYQVDGKNYDQIFVNSTLEFPFNYSAKLTNLADGVHSLKVYAYYSGWVLEAHELWEYEIPLNSSSSMVYFTVDNTPADISFIDILESVPTPLVIVPIALVAIIGVGLLFYFKKRKHTK
jgi:hypothetical protein